MPTSERPADELLEGIDFNIPKTRTHHALIDRHATRLRFYTGDRSVSSKINNIIMTKLVKKRPISRNFWSFLKYLPVPFRAKLIRSKFEIDYNLPHELIFKQAETTDEISQALRIVHDSYVDLNYIDAHSSKLHLTKYHALPTTIILIAKWDDEIIGTLSIILDSAFGIPSEISWNLNSYKVHGQQIAEISSLSIKKGSRGRRGKLFMPLCKLMYLFCNDILKLDGIIVSVTIEVEPFYTDILLFKKVAAKTNQGNIFVKNNPSTCCYLAFDQNNAEEYKKIYAKKVRAKNLFYYFGEEKTNNIRLPDVKRCLQAYMQKQNVSLAQIIKENPEIINSFNEKDRLILKNIDITDVFSIQLENEQIISHRKSKRYLIRQKAWLYEISKKIPVAINITDLSKDGLKIVLTDNVCVININDNVMIFFEFENKIAQLTAKVRWLGNNRTLGCEITSSSQELKSFFSAIYQELSPNEDIIEFI